MKVCVIGGGIIGLFSAYYLNKAGHEVIIVDQGDLSSGTSFGNAGMICPSHFIPLAAPGVISQSIKWMFDATSPFYIKPTLNVDLVRWCFDFFKHSNARHVADQIGPLSALLNWSRQLYLELYDQGWKMDLQRQGIIMACNSSNHLEEEIKLSKKANKIGIPTQILSRSDIELLNPGTSINALGGVHYTNDMHVTPGTLMQSLKSKLSNSQISWMPHTEVKGFTKVGTTIQSVITNSSEIIADQFVLAAGAWSGRLAHLAGSKILIQPGKGYNVTLDAVIPGWQTPLILVEGRVAVTPMGKSLRLGGTMEIGGFDRQIRPQRIKGILNTIKNYLPDIDENILSSPQPWYGYRPLSSTGLPIISRLPALQNLYINSGHGMLGLSLAPASGLLLSQLMTSELNRVSSHEKRRL